MKSKKKSKITKFKPNEAQKTVLDELYGSDDVVKLKADYFQAVDSGNKRNVSDVRARTGTIAERFTREHYDSFSSDVTKKKLTETVSRRLRDMLEREYYAEHPEKKRPYISHSKKAGEQAQKNNEGQPSKDDADTGTDEPDVPAAREAELPGFREAMAAAKPVSVQVAAQPETAVPAEASEPGTGEDGSNPPEDNEPRTELEKCTFVLCKAVSQAATSVNDNLKKIYDLLDAALFNKNGCFQDKNGNPEYDGFGFPLIVTKEIRQLRGIVGRDNNNKKKSN